jgi:hypothetical protein
MEQDSYLSSHKGQYAESYAARPGLVHKLDLRFVQGYSFNAGKTKNTIQVSLDVLNIGNLINSNWGVNKNMAASNYGKILKYDGKDANNVPSFSTIKVSGEYPTETYSPYINNSQCWSLQIGVRYIFN